MKAMVLAAGLGTRLRPLTDARPKALVELGGRTLLEITLSRLRRFGVTEAIVNVHHFADMVVDYLRAHDNFGMRIAISREDELLLDTGGGLFQAADFFLRDSNSRSAAGEPFLLHNVDVISDVDLGKMAEFHRRQNALATLAVQRRASSRILLFEAGLELRLESHKDAPESAGLLCGRRSAGQPDEMFREAAQPEPWAFTGIHVLSPRIFGRLAAHLRGGAPDAGPGQAFPIIPEYLRLAGAGETILGWAADGYYWRDLGTFASLERVAEDLERNLVEI